jgi:hypothetical protein
MNPDYMDGTLMGLASEKIDKGAMDAAAISLANSYEDSLGVAIGQRAKCGAFFSFDRNNNMNLDTVLAGALRDRLLGGGEGAARFLYENPDCADIIGLKGIKRTYQDGNDTITYYEISEESAAKLMISPSQMRSLVKIIDFTNMNSYNSGNVSSMNRLLDTAVQNGYLLEAVREMLVGITLLESRQACIDYSDSYVKTIDYALKLYENSSASAYRNMSSIESLYGNLEYMGFCNRSYTGVGSQLCRQLEAEVSSNATTYYSRALDNDAALRNSMNKMPPNLTYAVEGTNLMWSFIYSNSGIGAEYAQKMSSFSRALADAQSKAASNSKLLAETTAGLSSQKLGEITEIYIPEGPLSSSIGNIAASFAQYDEESSQASAELERLNGLAREKPYGWAADAYDGYVSLNSMASEAIVSAKETLYYAAVTVNYTRSQAVSIADSKKSSGYNVSSIYEKVGIGDRQTTLGDKFLYYKDAYMSALSLLGPESSGNESETLALLKSGIMSMIANAKKDGIDVSSEETEFSLYKDNPNMRLAIEHMGSIRQSIISKAKTSFSDLQATRARLVRYFEADQRGVLDSVRQYIASQEAGMISGSSIDYEAGLGHLSALRAAYASAESQIKAMLGSYLASEIVPVVEYAPPLPDMNAMSYLSGTIRIDNPLPEEVDNVGISFQPPLPLEPSEIYGISAKKSGNVISFTIPRLQPLETKTFEFRKQGIFAEGTLESSETAGMGGTAYIKESWLLQVSAPLAGLHIGAYEKTSLDGVEYPGGTITRPLEIRTYEATAEKSKDNAYTVSESQTSGEDAQSTIIWRAILISPTMHFDSITLGKEPACRVNSSSYYYTEIQSEAVLKKVDGAGEVDMVCTYPKDVVHETIGNLIGGMDGMNLSDQERQRLDNITILLGMGQNSTALSELLSLNRSIALRMEAERKANGTFAKQLSLMDMEIASLNESVALAGSLNHSSYITDIYMERRDSLLSLRERAVSAGPNDAGVLFSGYDAQWSGRETAKWLSQAFANFTKIEKSYNDNGMDSPAISGYMSLFRTSYVKAKSAQGNLTYAVYCSYYLEGASDAVLSALAGRESGLALIKGALDAALSELESNLTSYEAIYNDAKQYKLESYMPYAPSYFSSEIAKLKKGTTEKQLRQYINQSASLGSMMSSGIGGIAKVAEGELSRAEQLLGQSKSKLDSGTVSGMENSLKAAESAMKAQKYGQAINIAKGVSADIGTLAKQKEEGDTRMLAICLLLVGSLAVILYSYREPIMGLLGTRKGKIALRKLRKGEDERQE